MYKIETGSIISDPMLHRHLPIVLYTIVIKRGIDNRGRTGVTSSQMYLIDTAHCLCLDVHILSKFISSKSTSR
jgi:hypothetical protein